MIQMNRNHVVAGAAESSLTNQCTLMNNNWQPIRDKIYCQIYFRLVQFSFNIVDTHTLDDLVLFIITERTFRKSVITMTISLK